MDLHAPSTWRRLDFISDLHLQPADGATYQAFVRYLDGADCDALFILGDLFEVWVGDDCLGLPDSFERLCADALARTARRLPIFILHGNRDFLMGPALMAACGARLLDDPTVLIWAQQRWLLSHADALCLDDQDYQKFRLQVRSAEWQQNFLAQSLELRLEVARGMRQQSEARKQAVSEYADVDTAAALALLQAHQAQTLIHGHTHRPAQHALDAQHTRYVLSDWDASATPARLEVMRWSWSGQNHAHATCTRIALPRPKYSPE